MREIKKIAVIGGGLMGSGIAQVVAEAGLGVCVNDISSDLVNNAIKNINKRWESKLKKNKISEEDLSQLKTRLTGDEDIEKAVKDADMVIEAASEKINIKAEIFTRLGDLCPADVIIASNTSSISITKLAGFVKHPERFIGTHFFSPVPAMKLMEIIPGLLTDRSVVDKVFEIGSRLGKICVESKDTIGFIVNKLLDPMVNDAIKLLDDGVGTVEDIDAAMKYGCGHPMGPFELMDMAGIDIEYAVMQVFYEETGDVKYMPAPLLKKMIQSGLLGKKTGKGWYIYHDDGTKTVNPVLQRLK